MALSQIVLIFKRGTDIMQARQLVQERLALAGTRLPVGIGPPVMLQPLSATSRIMKIGISSKDMSLLDLSMTTYWKIRFRLLQVPGRRQRADLGRALEAAADPGRSRTDADARVSLDDVMEAASGALDFGLLLAHQVGQDPDRRVHRDPQSTARDQARLAGDLA